MKRTYIGLLAIMELAFLLFSAPALLAAVAPPMGTASTFSVLAGLSMSAAGAGTTVTGDLGLSPGLAVSRTGPWTVGGTEYFGPLSLAATAQTDALAAYNNLAGQASNGTWAVSPWSPVPGVWTQAVDTTFSGVITLNGNSNDVWVFQVGRDMTFTGTVILAGTAQACNVFWQIGRDATIATGSSLVGTLIASRDITLVSGATVDGRIISLNSSLTTDGNTVGGPTCILGPPCPVITVNPATLPNGSVGTPYNVTITATGGIGPYTFTVTSGALPLGLVLNPATGAITGTPSVAGTSNFSITATDTATGCLGTRAFSLAIAIGPPGPPGGGAAGGPTLDFFGLAILLALLAMAGVFAVNRFSS